MLDRLLLRIALAALLATSALAQSVPEHPIVFTRLPVQGLSDAPTRARLAEGPGQLVLRLPGGETETLSSGFYGALDPNISFDGERLLFAGKKSSLDQWDIFEMDLKTRRVRQITRDLGNCRKPVYQATFYTIVSPEPWYQITFVSDEAGEISETGDELSTNLYSCRLDGSEVRRLTFNPSSDNDPVMLEDGRVLYSALQWSTPRVPSSRRSSLFTINADGTDLSVFAADEGERFKRLPCPTPNGLIVFVESEQSQGRGAGHLAAVRFKRHLHSYRRLTEDQEGLFHFPTPYGENRILVSGQPPGKNAFALYLYDLVTDRLSPFHENPDFHCLQSRVVLPRPEIDGRSSVVNEKDPNGQIYALNVTLSDLPDRDWMTMESVTRVRFLEGIPRKQGEQLNSPLLHKRVLGEIPVQKDGSFFVEVPANIPIQLQLLDADGLALRTCSWIWTKNHERRGCIGCHEDPELTPPNRMVDAVKRPPVHLTLPPQRRRRVDFRRHVMPVIQSSCAKAGCHTNRTNPLEIALSSSESRRQGELARVVFEALVMPAQKDGGLSGPKYIVPGQARTSPLIWHIFGRDTSRPWDNQSPELGPPRLGKPLINEEERRIFVEWIDFGAHWDSGASNGTTRPVTGGPQ